MRIESSVTSVSWIPSELASGFPAAMFELGVMSVDPPLPDRLGDLDDWGRQARFRFVNDLRVYVEVDDDGRVREAGYLGGGIIGRTKLNVGRRFTFRAIPLPDRQAPAVFGGGEVVFEQSAGGRVPLPAPRRLDRPPYWQLVPPVVWTTLRLVVRTDGTASFEVRDASPFPRHWVYDADGALAAKVGVTDFDEWYRRGPVTSPWGDERSPALVTAAETALERRLADTIMRDAGRAPVATYPAGAVLCRQGEPGAELYLLLDGVVSVDVDGTAVAELGPGAVIGERALLEAGERTATVTATTAVKAVVVPASRLDLDALRELAEGHRHEETA